MTAKKTVYGFATKSIHVGQEPESSTGAVIPPIFQTSTFAQESPGKHKGYEYSRTLNPTRKALEDCVASLEDMKYGFALYLIVLCFVSFFKEINFEAIHINLY